MHRRYGGDQGEEKAGDGEEGFDSEEVDCIFAGLRPYVPGLKSGRGKEGDGFEMVDFVAKVAGREKNREYKEGERDRHEEEDKEEKAFGSEENFQRVENDLQRENTTPE